MSKSEDDQALSEIMDLIRQPAKDAKQTQAQFLLGLVKSALKNETKSPELEEQED